LLLSFPNVAILSQINPETEKDKRVGKKLKNLIMKNYVKGNLRGFNCRECAENISGVIIRLYEPIRQGDSYIASELNLLTRQQVEAKSNRLIAEGRTDEIGNFSIEVSEKYLRSEFEIDFVCGSVPRGPLPPKKGPVSQFHVMNFQPKWESNNDNFSIAQIDLEIPFEKWCYIKGKIFDVWTICGKLVNCDTKNPLVGITVTAMDADLITDDVLGAGLTDSNGNFTIYYSSSDFRVNFIPFNLETDLDFPFLSSGPDVYFKGSIGTTEIFNETAKLRRKNVGYCLCVELCANSNVVVPGTNLYSAWTRIGNAFKIPTGPILYDFDADGFAGIAKYGLFKTIRLAGQAPHLNSNGNHVQYRFLISDVTTPNGSPSPADANFNKIIGVTSGLLAETLVGELSKASFPGGTLDVYSKPEDFDAEGWFDVNKSIQRSFTDAAIPPAEQSDWFFIDNDTLLALNTTALVAANPFTDVVAGQAIPASDFFPIKKVAIRFEVREFNPITLATATLPGSGRTLNSAVINNDEVFAKYVVTELGIGGCSPLSNDIHAAYSVHHPLLQSATLRIRNNSNTVNRLLTDTFLTVSGNTSLAVNNGNNTALKINKVPNDMPMCTYVLELNVQRRLHTGDVSSNAFDGTQQIFFFYQP
jgi:hypothetical protein